MDGDAESQQQQPQSSHTSSSSSAAQTPSMATSRQIVASHRPHSSVPRSASRRAHGQGLTHGHGHGPPGGSASASGNASDPSHPVRPDDPHAASSGLGADAKDGLELEPATLSALTMRFMPLIECFLTVCASVALKAPPPMPQDTAAADGAGGGSKAASTSTNATVSHEASLSSSSSSSSLHANVTSSSSSTNAHVTGGKRKASDAELDPTPPLATTIDMTVESAAGSAADDHAAGVIAIADAIREGCRLASSRYFHTNNPDPTLSLLFLNLLTLTPYPYPNLPYSDLSLSFLNPILTLPYPHQWPSTSQGRGSARTLATLRCRWTSTTPAPRLRCCSALQTATAYYSTWYDERQVTSHHITPHHITPHHITPHHITSYHITSRHITSHHITSHHIISHHITSHHITSHHITSYHITPHHITSYHIISYHITSHHITMFIMFIVSSASVTQPNLTYPPVLRHPCYYAQVLRHNVHLLESSFSALISAPRCRHYLHFDIKRAFFKMRLKRMRQSSARQHGSLRINVSRQTVFEDSFQSLRHKTADEMRRRLSVTFHGEDGMDAGTKPINTPYHPNLTTRPIIPTYQHTL